MLFNNQAEFTTWLEKPSYGLNNSVPYNLLKQPGGIDIVLNELSAIKYGEAL